MNEIPNLVELEKRAFRSTYQDGLLDILLAVIFSQFAIGPLLTDIGFSDILSSAIFMPFYLIALVLFWACKKYLIAPRLGIVRFNPKRMKKISNLTKIFLLILVIGLILGILGSTGGLPLSYKIPVYPFIFSSILFIGFFLAAHYLNLTRLYYYGVLLASAGPIGEFLYKNSYAAHHGYPIVYGIASIVMLITGIILLVNFIRKYPVLTVGDEYDG